jgi:hypothetical protein
VVAVALVAVGTCAACSGPVANLGTSTSASGAASPGAPTPGATASASVAPAAPVEPLTGLPGSGSGSAVAVPVDVVSGGPAPSGLDDADIVSVEFGEGSLLRLVSMFRSHPAPRVGPVGMIRPSDDKFINEVQPLVAQSGAPKGFLEQATAAHLAVRSAFAGAPGYSISGDLAYVNVDALRSVAKATAAPRSMFTYAPADRPISVSGVSAATRVVIAAPGHPTITWAYDSVQKIWKSTIGGAAVTTANLVILTTPYLTKHVSSLRKDLTYTNPVGQGKGIMISADNKIAVSWDKRNPLLAMNFLGPDQSTPELTPGRTWIFLTPTGATVTTS